MLSGQLAVEGLAKVGADFGCCSSLRLRNAVAIDKFGSR